MSRWTSVRGTVTVSPIGESQPEKRYILDTVLAHLPKVTGSEANMNTYIIQKNGFDSYCTDDEFGQYSNLGNDNYPYDHHSFSTQSEYIIVVDANLRDREFATTMKEFSNWLCRLSKRILVCDVLVEVSEDYTRCCSYKSYLFRNDNDVYGEMYEWPSWTYTGQEKGQINWCEFMLWSRAKDSSYPMMLAYKYNISAENNMEAKRRLDYDRRQARLEVMI